MTQSPPADRRSRRDEFREPAALRVDQPMRACRGDEFTPRCRPGRFSRQPQSSVSFVGPGRRVPRRAMYQMKASFFPTLQRERP